MIRRKEILKLKRVFFIIFARLRRGLRLTRNLTRLRPGLWPRRLLCLGESWHFSISLWQTSSFHPFFRHPFRELTRTVSPSLSSILPRMARIFAEWTFTASSCGCTGAFSGLLSGGSDGRIHHQTGTAVPLQQFSSIHSLLKFAGDLLRPSQFPSELLPVAL